MKPIGIFELQNLRHAVQHFQDCYLVSSIGALTQSGNGRKILMQNIAHTNDGFRIRFNNINGYGEDFFVTEKEMEALVYMDKFKNPIEIDQPHNPIIKAVEVAMNKLLGKYPSKKPWICRFPDCNEKFEFNKPSIFLEMFTGKLPIKINESSLMMNLKRKEETGRNILDSISERNDSSFVAGTLMTFNKKLSDYHCYNIKSVNKETNEIELFDHRSRKIITLTYEEAIKYLKYIVGYFNKDLG